MLGEKTICFQPVPRLAPSHNREPFFAQRVLQFSETDVIKDNKTILSDPFQAGIKAFSFFNYSVQDPLINGIADRRRHVVAFEFETTTEASA